MVSTATGSRIIPANSVRLRIGDVHHIVCVERDRCRPCQIHFQRRAVTVESMFTCSHYCRDDPGLSIHFADPVAA